VLRVQLLLVGIWVLPIEETTEPENDPDAESAGRGKRKPPVSWPEALRAVRA
jgi:hypothetical protein